MKIALYVCPVAGGWNPLDGDSLGGGEDTIVSWSRAMAARGHDVTVFWDQGPGLDRQHAGTDDETIIHYMPYAVAQPGTYDVAVYRKTPEAAALKLAPVQILWTDQVRPFDPTPFTRIVVASQFLARAIAALHPPAEQKLVVIPDGYDPSLFAEPVPAREKDLVLFASSPDRGLLDVLHAWRQIRETVSARLLITYGWDLFLKCHGDPSLRTKVENLIRGCPEITMGRLSRSEIHRAFQRAGVWAYWCNGGEFFCQTAVKAQLGGAVPVVRKWGALHETVWSGLSADSPRAFAEALREALNPERQDALRAQIGSNPIAQTWDSVAGRWECLCTDAPDSLKPVPLLQTPGTPTFLLPRPDLLAQQVLPEVIGQWLGTLRPTRPFLDPSLGVSVVLPPGTGPSDALIAGWAIEDAVTSPPETLAAFANGALPEGLPILVVTSYGPWRAARRKRHLVRRDLLELFGKQPDFNIRVVPLDGEGNGLMATSFRFSAATMGARDVSRAARLSAPRETLSVCFISRPMTDRGAFLSALRSVQPVADEIVVAVNGTDDERNASPSRVRVADVLESFGKETGIRCLLVQATSPRHCFDCGVEHDLGSVEYGHRMAGFETPRNQSVGAASGDWILWLDTDEELLGADRIDKYLRPNGLAGYALQQHHHSVDPPAAAKVDWPVRLFRRIPDGSEAGWYPFGPHQWPTWNPGTTFRFAGVVHEHPGCAPEYTEGVAPVMLITDVWISHPGYLTEAVRRGRFQRNWPLMVADGQKYPDRRLRKFLELRDLNHHMRYELERGGGQVSPAAVQLAEQQIQLWQDNFVDRVDAFWGDAHQYVSGAMDLLQRGWRCRVHFEAWKPEVSGEEKVGWSLEGRFQDFEELAKHIAARKGEVVRFEGPWL